MSTSYVDCTSLRGEWDSSETIRSRLRGDGTLVTPLGKGQNVNIQYCVSNYECLIPILAQIGAGSRLAEIDGLRDAVADTYSANQREATTEMIDEDAWSIRDMVSFVKRKTQRREVSLVHQFELLVYFVVLSPLVVVVGFSLCIFFIHQGMHEPKDGTFQSLCLLINPSLEDGTLSHNHSIEICYHVEVKC